MEFARQHPEGGDPAGTTSNTMMDHDTSSCTEAAVPYNHISSTSSSPTNRRVPSPTTGTRPVSTPTTSPQKSAAESKMISLLQTMQQQCDSTVRTLHSKAVRLKEDLELAEDHIDDIEEENRRLRAALSSEREERLRIEEQSHRMLAEQQKAVDVLQRRLDVAEERASSTLMMMSPLVDSERSHPLTGSPTAAAGMESRASAGAKLVASPTTRKSSGGVMVGSGGWMSPRLQRSVSAALPRRNNLRSLVVTAPDLAGEDPTRAAVDSITALPSSMGNSQRRNSNTTPVIVMEDSDTDDDDVASHHSPLQRLAAAGREERGGFEAVSTTTMQHDDGALSSNICSRTGDGSASSETPANHSPIRLPLPLPSPSSGISSHQEPQTHRAYTSASSRSADADRNRTLPTASSRSGAAVQGSTANSDKNQPKGKLPNTTTTSSTNGTAAAVASPKTRSTRAAGGVTTPQTMKKTPTKASAASLVAGPTSTSTPAKSSTTVRPSLAKKAVTCRPSSSTSSAAAVTKGSTTPTTKPRTTMTGISTSAGAMKKVTGSPSTGTYLKSKKTLAKEQEQQEGGGGGCCSPSTASSPLSSASGGPLPLPVFEVAKGTSTTPPTHRLGSLFQQPASSSSVEPRRLGDEIDDDEEDDAFNGGGLPDGWWRTEGQDEEGEDEDHRRVSEEFDRVEAELARLSM